MSTNLEADPAYLDSDYQARRLARAVFVAKRLAQRFETVMQDRKVHGMHALDHAGWCRNSMKLIERAKNF